MWYEAAMRGLSLIWMSVVGAVLLLGACSDDAHKGDPSTGPAPSASAKVIPRTRLVYDPKTPIATARVAGIFKRRLEAVKIDGGAVKIAGQRLHIDVNSDQVEAVKEALAGGRADLWLAAPADPLADLKEVPEGATLEEETQGLPKGQAVSHFLKAKTTDALFPGEKADLGDAAGGAKVFTGPLFEDGAQTAVRTYLVQPDRSIRGEFIETARVEEKDGAVTLVVPFNASGKSFVRWNTKQGERFVLVVEGEVVGTAFHAEEQKDGTLRFSVAGRPRAEVETIAKAVKGKRAVSHEVDLEETKEIELPPGL